MDRGRLSGYKRYMTRAGRRGARPRRVAFAWAALAVVVLAGCDSSSSSPTDASRRDNTFVFQDSTRDAPLGEHRHPDGAVDGPLPALDQLPPPTDQVLPLDQDLCGGACSPWEVCTPQGTCACATPLPAGWPSSFVLAAANPMLVPTSAVVPQGNNNIYAPEIHPLSDGWAMWYGGQGSDSHDQIFLATSTDGATWRKWPNDNDPQPVLARGASNHVNDPSLVQVGGTWRMYYTDAATGIDDRIWLAESSSLTGFAKVQEVLGPGGIGSWEALKVGRPAVLLEGGVYKMWYDGQDGLSRHVGYATSTDGINFVRYAQNPVLLNAGAMDVKVVDGVYVMVHEGGDGTHWATSVDGVHCWTDRGLLFGLSGQAYDAFGQVTPFLQLASGSVAGVWFGGASVSTWDKNRIAVAYPAGATPPSGAGCTACLTSGWSCDLACQKAGFGAAGVCGNPGSSKPGACCACAAEGCESCRGAYADCHASCVAGGSAGGYCAFAGSSDPAQCCTCW